MSGSKDVSGGIIDVYDENLLPTPGRPGKGNARYNYITKDGKGPIGQKRSRWTNVRGEPIKDKDYNHSGENHVFPHFHEWINGQRK